MVDIEKCTTEDFIANKAEYLKYLENYSNWDKIPFVNHEPLNYPDNTLVRFRGMIQDMYNPEIYLESYEVCHSDGGKRVLTGKYKDMNRCSVNEQFNIDSDKNVNGERQTLFVISVPGLNDWVCEEEKFHSKTKVHGPMIHAKGPTFNALKRITGPDQCTEEELKRFKDQCDGMSSDTSSMISSSDEPMSSDDGQDESSSTVTDTSTDSGKVSLEYILNSPIPNKPSKAFIVKIYNDFDAYKVNEVVDVLGFLSTDPRMVSVGGMSENQADNLPPSVVPRLHAVTVRRVVHCNPLLDRTQAQVDISLLGDLPQQIKSYPEEAAHVRAHKRLHMALTHALFGDTLAADYTIFYLISRIFSRQDVTAVGSFNLNITNVPSESKMSNVKSYLRHFYEMLCSLVPTSHSISLTIDELNTASFVPKKDYTTDRLVSGQLQLSHGTCLFIDEVSLEEGKLNQAGVANLQALRTLVRDQTLKYDFQYYGVDYECDIPVLVLSEGKSILDIPNRVPLEIDTDIRDNFENIIPAVKRFLHLETQDLIRCYLTVMRYSEFVVDQELHEMIENDFVTMLREPGMTPEGLHSHLTLARLYGLSRGERKLTVEAWRAVKELEQKRRARLGPPKNAMEM